jgi:hypothetical protein
VCVGDRQRLRHTGTRHARTSPHGGAATRHETSSERSTQVSSETCTNMCHVVARRCQRRGGRSRATCSPPTMRVAEAVLRLCPTSGTLPWLGSGARTSGTLRQRGHVVSRG